MPPIRHTNHLCPVCLKPYNAHFWLNKHIDDAHPQYRAQQETKLSKPRAFPLPLPPSSSSKSKGKEPQLDTHNALGRLFHANHDNVNDPDALLSFSIPSPFDDAPAGGPDFDMGTTTQTYPDAGMPVPYVPTLDDDRDNARQFEFINNPFHPFKTEEEYNFAELVTLKGLSAGVIDEMLKGNYGPKDSLHCSLKSKDHLRQLIDRTEDGLGYSSWKRSTLSLAWNEQHPDNIVFWHRDIIECAKWLLRQPAYEDHLNYTPMRCFTDAGHRVYNEMHTGDWW